MKTPLESLYSLQGRALKLLATVTRAKVKSELGLPFEGELVAIHDNARSVLFAVDEHCLLYGTGGPEPRGLLNTRGAHPLAPILQGGCTIEIHHAPRHVTGKRHGTEDVPNPTKQSVDKT